MKLNLHPPKRARIEIIPLIDVIFFLLATFVLVSLTMTRMPGVPVTLPETVTAVPHDLVETVTLTVTEKRMLFWDKDFVTFDQFLIKLVKYTQERDVTKIRILLNADAKANFGDIIAVLDEIRKIQIQKVSIETKLKKII